MINLDKSLSSGSLHSKEVVEGKADIVTASHSQKRQCRVVIRGDGCGAESGA